MAANLYWEVEGPLNLDLMNDAARSVVGEHDFRAFCRRTPDRTSDDPIRRRVERARWRVGRDELEITLGRAPIYVFDVVAASFCHQMVRSLVSTMVAIGQGSLGVDVMDERLASGSRDRMPAPAPPAGLALVGVGYDPADGGPSDSVDEFTSALKWVRP